MLENLNIALQITVIGMGLVFASILLLWGGIALLVRVTTGETPVQSEPSKREAIMEQPVAVRELKQQAAATAVAVALAQHTSQPNYSFAPPVGQTISPWQAVLRDRQMEPRGRTR